MNIDGWIVNFLAAHPPPAILLHLGTLLKRVGEGDDLAFICIVFAIVAYLRRDGRAIRSAVMGIAALAASGIAVQTLKHLVGRARPRMDLGSLHFLGPNSNWNGFDSFPSGHSCSAFALAAYFSYYYPKARVYLFTFAAAIALIGRVLLRDHFLTDVIAGGALGGLVGAWIARRSSGWIEEGNQSAPSAAAGLRVDSRFPSSEALLSADRPHWKNLAIVAAFSGAILLFGLNRSALWDRDETEYAQAVIEMEQSGDWLIPTLEGQPFIEKPILLYWVTYAGVQVFGKNEIGFRFPSALLGILCCLLTYFIAQSLWGGGAGFKSAMILASSILFAGCFNLLMTDPIFIFFTLLSLLFYIFAQKNPARAIPHLIASHVAIGGAVLSKGPVGFFPVPVYLLFEYFTTDGSFSRFVSRNALKAALLSLIPAAIAAPWFIHAFSREQQATSTFFLYDNVYRFLQGMEGHTGPTYYYIVVLALGFFPWTAFYAMAAARDWRDRDVGRAGGGTIGAGVFLILTWTLFLFVFFSNSANKLPHYVAPILPAMACWTGKFWDDQERSGENMNRTFLWTLILGGVLLAAPVIGVFSQRPQYASLALFIPFILMLAQLGLARHQAKMGSWAKSFHLVALSGFLFLGAAKIWTLPAIDRFRVMRPIGEAIRAQVPKDAALYGYFVSEPSLFIYGGRTFPKIEDVSLDALLIRPGPVYVVVPDVWLKSGIPYEILASASGFAENSGELTLHLIRKKN